MKIMPFGVENESIKLAISQFNRILTVIEIIIKCMLYILQNGPESSKLSNTQFVVHATNNS